MMLSAKRLGRLEGFIRPYSRIEKPSVFRLLSFLPEVYPSGHVWLDNRLDEISKGVGTCLVISTRCGIGGIAIQTPKGSRRVKLSTFYLHPSLRGRGLGTQLLLECISGWKRSNVSESIVTVSSERLEMLSPLFYQHGFSEISRVKEKYRIGTDEVILRWRADEPVCFDVCTPPVC
jgi:GNAT superfamily N-acetyltransferase